MTHNMTSIGKPEGSSEKWALKFVKIIFYMDKYIGFNLTDRVHLSMREQYAVHQQ